MKKVMIKIFLLILLPAVFSYASGNKAVGKVTFSDIQDRDWHLAEVKKMSASVSIDRTDIPREIYTIRFKTSRLFGAGAGNAYFSSYTAGKNNAISIGRIASTRAVALYEMKYFTEYEYFQHLERVDRWDLRDGKLELRAYDENYIEVMLIFTEK